LAGELRALVGVEYLRLAVARQGVLQRLDAERRLMRRARSMLRGLLRNLDCYFGPATRGGWPLRLTSRRSSIWA
jgi:hypothetical protein